MTLGRTVPISVLDLSPVPSGATPGEALRSSIELARCVETWGYNRFWVAEHHNMAGIASSSPAVLISHVAAATSRMRVGSGGVMLPNHAPLVVAEQFGMLEALHPGRIDLGIGRAPGTDPLTASALRLGSANEGADDFPERFAELRAFFDQSFPDGHPYRRVHAFVAHGATPKLWLLGSSGYSAQVAGILGLPFAFAHHFSAANTLPALDLYRKSFRASETIKQPYAMVGVAVVCADDAAEARWQHGSSRLSMLRLRTGRPGLLPSPAEAAAQSLSPSEHEIMDAATDSHIVGDPDEVRSGLNDLLRQTGADELIVTSNLHAHHDRLRSFELLAALSGISGSLFEHPELETAARH